MTDREKAIVMAYTGVCMLTGEKWHIYHEYIEKIMGRPVQTIEMGFVADEIKEKSRTDFIGLCEEDQESCGDCISRSGTYKKMLDLQCKKKERYLDIDDVHNVIYKMPSVTPMPKWIPVSEKLPEIGQKVLMDTVGFGLLTGKYENAKYGDKEEGTFLTYYSLGSSKMASVEVIAWMPLPETYKAESED